MHLSDEQLLEIDALGELHLSQCKDCQQRADNVLNIRDKLEQLPAKSVTSDNWEKLKHTYQMRTDEINQLKNKKRIKFWKLSTVALAASLLLVVMLPKVSMMDKETSIQYQQLALLVEQNNVLQQQLIDLKPEIVTEPVRFSLLRYQFSVLDKSIQRAHIEQRSIEEKSVLWKKRQDLLKQWLATKQTSNTISI